VRPGLESPATDRTEPLWALAPSEAGACSTKWSKKRVSLACNANPAKAGGGVAGGRLQAILVTVVVTRLGPWWQKASWSSGMRFPSRGGAGMRILVGSKRAKGTPTLRKLRIDDHGVLEASSRRGTFIHLVMRRRMRGEGRSFARGISAHVKVCHRFNQPLPQAATGLMLRPQAAHRRAVAFGVQLRGVLAAPSGEPCRALRDSLPATFERRRLTQVVRLRRKPLEERGRTRRPSWRNADRNARAVRIGRSLGCARASLM
jgi:hypothetical protein